MLQLELGELGEAAELLQKSTQTVAAGASKKRARPRQDAGRWSLEPHVCRHCFGRLLSRSDGAGGRLYHCSNCGAEATGDAPDVLCSCGLKARRRGLDGRGELDLQVRCQPNPKPAPDFPSVYVAAEQRPQPDK